MASLASVTDRDGTLYDLRAAFSRANGWNVVAVEADRIQTRFHDAGAPAWLATIKRI